MSDKPLTCVGTCTCIASGDYYYKQNYVVPGSRPHETCAMQLSIVLSIKQTYYLLSIY